MHKAQANYAELKAGSRPQEIAAAEAEYHAAEVDRDHLKRDSDRDKELHRTDPGTISVEQVDRAAAAYRMANDRYLQALKRYDLVKEGPRQEDILQAKAAMEQAQAQYRLVKEGPRIEDIDQARAQLEQAKAQLQAAQTKLDYATVTSPLTGVVLSKNIEPGEYVAAGTPVVTVADIENVWLRAYVDERDLGKRFALHRGRDHHRRPPGQGLPGTSIFHRLGAGVHAQVGRDHSRAGEVRLSYQDRREESGQGVETGHAGRCHTN